MDAITKQVGEIRLLLEKELSDHLGKFQNGTPSMHVWPPSSPGKHTGLLVLICSAEIPIRQSSRGPYQTDDYYSIEVVLRQKDKSAQGVISLRAASDVVSAHFQRVTRISEIGKENYYRKDDDRDLTVIFRLHFNRTILRCAPPLPLNR